MLGGPGANGLITHFHFDSEAACDTTHYSPHTPTLNQVLESWNLVDIRLRGFAHSHPTGLLNPSAGDEFYARQILAANPELSSLLIVIIQSNENAAVFEMRVFVATLDSDGVRIESVPLRVEDAAQSTESQQHSKHSEHEIMTPLTVSEDAKQFDRVVEAYDLEVLDRLRIILIGVGGAASLAESLARAGVGQIALIDPDIVQRCNLATQQYYHNDVGKPKVDCVAERLRAVRPDIAVEPIRKKLEDIDDPEFLQCATGRGFAGKSSIRARQTIIVGATDSFAAQSRCNRLSLNFGLPSVCCQMYERGLAAEVTFVHLGTLACHRCILSSRFKAYLKHGYRNIVGSTGSPISSTLRLNSIALTVILILAHHGTNDSRWGDLLSRIGNRNLIQVRNHPFIETELGLKNFAQAFRGAMSGMLFFDEAIWRPQQPEHPENGADHPCPDCGGQGNLVHCKGTFADTRITIPEP